MTAAVTRRAWAHRDGKIALKALAADDWSLDAVIARAQIAEAFYRFGVGFDEARAGVVGSCFTADAVYEVGRGSGDPETRFEGRAQIIERVGETIARLPGQRRHCIGNVLVERLTPQAASAVAYGVVPVVEHGCLTVRASVIYSGELVKEPDGAWRFGYFFIGMDTYVH